MYERPRQAVLDKCLTPEYRKLSESARLYMLYCTIL